MLSPKKYTLIIGASYGIGLTFAQEFHQLGHNLIITARSLDKLEKIKQDFDAKHQSNAVEIFAGDFSKPDVCHLLYDYCRDHQFDVNVLVYNAAAGVMGFHLNYSDTELLNACNLNMVSLVILCSLFGRHMKTHKSGWILNISSVAGHLPQPYLSIYSASKKFLIHFSESLAMELESDGVAVKHFDIGFINTGAIEREAKKFNLEINLEDLPSYDNKVTNLVCNAQYGIKLLYSKNIFGIFGSVNKIGYYLSQFLPRKTIAKIILKSSKKLLNIKTLQNHFPLIETPPKPYTLITDATAGSGLAFAQAYHQLGKNLILVAPDPAPLEQLKKTLDSKNQKNTIQIFIADLSKIESCYALYEFCEKNKYCINLLINHASASLINRVLDTPEIENLNQLTLNFISPFLLCTLFGRKMMSAQSGNILNISSFYGFLPAPYMAIYGASKAALTHFSEALAMELEPFNISVKCLCPGYVKTNFFKKLDPAQRIDDRFLNFIGGYQTTQDIAQSGIQLLASTQLTRIPGIFYKIIYFLSRFLPVKWRAKMMKSVNKKLFLKRLG